MARFEAALAAAAGLALALVGCGPREFRVSGAVTIASQLQARAPKQSSVMFIVAKNAGGVPLAVKRIVNPAFPVSFTLGDEDLVVPGTRPTESLKLEVEMNTHGNVGAPKSGDLLGTYPDPVHTGDRRVHIVIDRQI